MRHHTTFRQLEIFEAIARLSSFTRASEELFLTQPTVSMQMKKLTEEVGVPLVEQVGKKIRLTPDGQQLAQATREIFGILDRYTMSVAERQGLKQGKLSLMAITTASYFAPRLLGEFAKLYPGIDVSLRVTNKEQVLASIADNLDDLYFLGQPPEELVIGDRGTNGTPERKGRNEGFGEGDELGTVSSYLRDQRADLVHGLVGVEEDWTDMHRCDFIGWISPHASLPLLR
jgi:DNA-binding transcriptional ArsR family regulator